MSFRRDPRKTSVGLQVSTEYAKISEYGVQEDAERYYVTFLDADGEREICLSSFMARPHIALLAARFIHATSLSSRPATRYLKLKLFGYIFDYLDEIKSLAGIDVRTVFDFDQEVIDGFQKYLNGNKKFSRKLRLSGPVKKSRYNFLIRVLKWAKQTDYYSGNVSEVISRTHLWSKAHRRRSGHESLTTAQVIKTRKACRTEIIATLEKLTLGQSASSSPSHVDLHGKSVVPFKEMDIRLAAFWQVIAEENPDVELFRKKYPGLSRVLRAPYGSIDEAVSNLFFTWRSIVPFVVLAALETGYNPSTQCGIEQSDISDHPLWPDTVRLAPKKYRADGKLQVRTFKKERGNPFSLPILIHSISNIVGFYRHLATPENRRYVFLVWNRMGEEPKPLINSRSVIDNNFYRALNDFCKTHGLGEWTLSSLRQTVADLVHLVSDGDLEAIKTMMGHNSVRTSERHYKSKGQQTRRASHLAKAVRERQRFIDSQGKISLHEAGMGMPQKGATPGFLCWDLLTSPIPGQKKGRLCSAYGCCPACPLACAQIDDPVVRQRLLQLKELYLRTRDHTDHLRWAMHWNPHYEALIDIWLPKIDEAHVASTAHRNLEPLPGLE